MNKLKSIILILLLTVVATNGLGKEEKKIKNKVDLIPNETEQKVDVLVDGKLFTSFLYTDKLSVLKKTVLYPLISAKGVAITRGYPLNPRPNERTDHPHHIGAWLNYGDVNNLDFWGNSDAMPEDKVDEMGTIRLMKINKIESGESGTLNVTSKWINSKEEIILMENTEFIFSGSEGRRSIDWTTTLTATKEPVIFEDTKEGMFAIRVARQLELPSDEPITLSDAHGFKTEVKVLDNTGVTGNYLSSEGLEGNDVWGTRAKWVALSGTVDTNDVTVVIMDEPNNIGYPTYWMARGYGLFAANPLGQKIYSNGKEELNFSLAHRESVTFKYRIMILDSKMSKEQLESEYYNYISKLK